MMDMTHWYWAAETNGSTKQPGWTIGPREKDVIWYVNVSNIGEEDLTSAPASNVPEELGVGICRIAQAYHTDGNIHLLKAG